MHACGVIIAPTETGYRATLDGIVASFSPMSQESKRKCFNGRITDGEASLRFVGFTKEQQAQISKLAADDAIALADCSIRKSRSGDSLDIIHSTTTISKSSKKFDPSIKPCVDSTDTVKELHLDELEHQPSFQKVKISAKVIKIGDTNTIEDGRCFQTVLLANHTGTAELALWEDFVGAVNNGESYTFNYLTVKIFHDKPSLFTPRKNAIIDKIADLQNVVLPTDSIKHTKEIQHARVLAVSDFATIHKCIACRDGSVLPIGSSESDVAFGKCSECETVVQMDSCSIRKSALLTVKMPDEILKLLAVNDLLSILAKLPLDEVTEIALLTGKEFKIIYNSISKLIIEVFE